VRRVTPNACRDETSSKGQQNENLVQARDFLKGIETAERKRKENTWRFVTRGGESFSTAVGCSTV